MTSAEPTQQLTAEVHWGGDAGAVLWVGSAPVHQFWPMLAPHFGDSFLPPQRRTEGDAVAWSWREGGKNDSPSAELAALRTRLSAGLHSFATKQPRAAGDDESSRAKKTRENLALLLAVLEGFVAELLAKPDAELLRFVAQTEAGFRLHSWGAKQAARPVSPDQLGREVSGMVIHSGKGATGVDVLLQTLEGELKAQTRSDEAGHFRFLNVQRGRYRLLGRHAQLEFASQGTPVSVEGEAITGLKLRPATVLGQAEDTADSDPPEESQPKRNRRRRRSLVWLAAGGAAAGLAVEAHHWLQPDSKTPQTSPAEPAQAHPRVTESNSVTRLARLAAARSSDSPSSGCAKGGGSGDGGGDAPAAAGGGSPTSGPALDQTSAPGSGAAAPAGPASSGGGKAESPSEGKAASGGRSTGAGSHRPTALSTRSPAREPKADPSSQPDTPFDDPPKPDQPKPPPQPSLQPGDEPSAATEPSDSGAVPAPGSGWTRQTRLQDFGWKVRLLIDPILPTAPSGDFSFAELEKMRQRLMAEQRAKIPRTFAEVKCARGFSIEGAALGYETLPRSAPAVRWRLPASGAGVRAEVTPGHAELSGPAGGALPAGEYSLVDADNVPLVRLRVAGGRMAEIAAASAVQIHYWIEIPINSADPRNATRFKWQRAAGGSLPAGWRERPGPQAMRIEAPVESATGAAQAEQIALFDPESGWGLTTVLTQTPESTL